MPTVRTGQPKAAPAPEIPALNGIAMNSSAAGHSAAHVDVRRRFSRVDGHFWRLDTPPSDSHLMLRVAQISQDSLSFTGPRWPRRRPRDLETPGTLWRLREICGLRARG